MNNYSIKFFYPFSLIFFLFLIVGCTNQFKNESKTIEFEHEDYLFNNNGFGEFKINQVLNETFYEVENSRIDDCFFAKNKDIKLDVNFQIINDKIAVISSRQSGASDSLGVRVGDDESTIFQKNTNKKFEKKLNPYGDQKNDYSIIYWSDAMNTGLRYDIESEKVVAIYVGNENVNLMEGCA